LVAIFGALAINLSFSKEEEVNWFYGFMQALAQDFILTPILFICCLGGTVDKLIEATKKKGKAKEQENLKKKAQKEIASSDNNTNEYVYEQ